MRKLLLGSMLFLASCGYSPTFKNGSYVKHIQSDCVGIVTTTYTFGKKKGHVVLEDYICKIKHEKFKHIMKNFFDVHESNLKFAGSETVDEYNQAMVSFIIKEK